MKTINLRMLLTAVTLLFLAACKDDETITPEVPKEINLASNATLGTILVDGNGSTLYFFAKDTKGTSTCNDGCTNTWPVFYVEGLEVGTGLISSDFGEITRSDGEKQITYKGWPLYYYSPASDGVLESPGETLGDGVNNVWYVAKDDYSLMIADAQLVGHDGLNYTSEYVAGDGSTKYFTDEYGRTLYMFTKDYKDDNNFTAADLSNNSVWPVYHVEMEDLPSYINSTEFGEITLADGITKQTTFRGWPLYYFGQDAMVRGSNKGVSFPSPGVWPILNNETAMALDAPTVITTEDDVFGTIITDAAGNSLYFFTKDANGTNNCTGGCAPVWPVFHVATITLKAGSVLSAGDFSEIILSDGVTKQTTYKGWPLYYYSPTSNGVIEATGSVGGDGVNNVWRVAKESYDLMYADAQLVGHDGINYIYSGGAITTGTGITKYFTDAYGRTIYTFKNDTKDDNNFTASDFSNDSVWPIFHLTIDELPSGMDKSEFGEIDVFGRKQLTFRGWPLYYFGQDQMIRGNNKGISFPSPGVWPIAKDDLAAAQ
jgi:predicted lipoprotein with Yx(FWY)xxD motif